MSARSLQEVLDSGRSEVRALRAIPRGPGKSLPGLALEHTNWRLEQRAWHDGVALMDQSHHMADLVLKGAGALALLRRLAVNDLSSFPVSAAKQFIAVTEEGYLVGDGVLARTGADAFHLMGDAGLVDWVRFHAENAAEELTVDFDPDSAARAAGHPPRRYRYQVQGPHARALIERATGEPAPDVRFFGIVDLTIEGRTVAALRHGMAGQPGFELSGPWEDRAVVLPALLAAGAELGLAEVGWLAYFTASLESGWFYAPAQGYLVGESSRPFREWLPAEAVRNLGGSFDSERIEDYLVTPYELGYGPFVDLDHEFLGRAALARLRDDTSRRKVTLAWDAADLAAVTQALVEDDGELPPQPVALHDASYSFRYFDAVEADGVRVGYAVQSAYLAPHRRYLSLAVVDAVHAEPGTRLELVWGDSLAIPRAEVEPHRQVRIGVTVVPTPFERYAREQYRR